MKNPRKHPVARYRTARAAVPPTDWGDGFVAEAAARMTVPAPRIRAALRAAERLSDAELSIVEQLAQFVASGASATRRRAVADGLRRALQSLTADRGSDPLATADDAIDAAEGAEAVLRAELETEARRRQLLQACVGAAEASSLIGRSRQALERLRREGRALALRVGNQWRYPRWQFDPDAPGGVVAGLSDVLARLHLSPAGAAHWLTRAAAQLQNRSPIDALRRREREAVLRLATEQGIMP